MRKSLVRVELKDMHPNASREEKERAFKNLLSSFKRHVNEAGILSECKQRQFYESRNEKRKRKAKEAQAELQKEKIRSHFSNKKD